MDVSNKVVFLIVIGVLQLAIGNVVAMDYLVGGEKGWATNIDYRSWTKDKIFQVGDRLVFRYHEGAHNVVEVKREAFKNCVAPITSRVLTSGSDIIELTTAGRKWYISDVGDQCSDGQKLAITVFPTPLCPQFPEIPPGPLSPPLPFWPLMPGIPYGPCYQRSPSAAPTPSSSKVPPGWWELFPPMSSARSLPSAPGPSFDFPWKLFFPPSAAPAPAPSFDFPWKLIFPPSAAPSPAPSFDFPWKLLFPPSAAPAPTIEFPWTWLFPPMSNAPSSSS